MNGEPSETILPNVQPQLSCIAEQPWDTTSAVNSTSSSMGPFWVQTARTAQWYETTYRNRITLLTLSGLQMGPL
jgi:hypothetical protein